MTVRSTLDIREIAAERARRGAPEIRFDAAGHEMYEPDGAVLSRFVMSDNKVDIIQGPIGSGKTISMFRRVGRHAMQQKPGRDGIRRTRWFIARNCYDDQTEILTERRGWVLFRDLDEGEKVAQLRYGELEFVEPTYYYQAPYVGEMVGLENEGVDFRVTPDHRMWVSKLETRKHVWSDYRFAHAEDIYGNVDFRVRRDAAWKGVDPGRSVAFCEWLGFWFAEGSAGVYLCADGVTRRQCVITQVKPDGVCYARRLFEAAGLAFSEIKRSDAGVTLRLLTSPATRSLVEELATTGKSTTKRVPQWLKDAPPQHIRAFIDGYIAGDGHRGAATVAYTSSQQLADDLQDLALRAGLVANVSFRDRRGVRIAINGVATAATAIEWTVTFVTESKFQPRLKRQGYAGRYRGWYRERYAGTVYCIEVPTHVVYVRRNGKAFWCSQTFPELKRTTIRTWQRVFPPHLYGPVIMGAPPRHHLRFGDIDMEVDFLSLDDAQDIGKLRSADYTAGCFHEVQYMQVDLVREGRSRTNRFPEESDGGATWHGVIADANAPDEDHWLALMTGKVDLPDGLTEEEKRALAWPADWGFFEQPPATVKIRNHRGEFVRHEINLDAENLRWLPSDYYLDLLQANTENWINNRLGNESILVIDGSPVWPMFRRDFHVSREALRPIEGHDVLVWLDFGRVYPGALFAQQLNNRLYVQYEKLGFNEGATIFAPKVKRILAEKYPGFSFRCVGDPKGADKGQATEHSAYDIFRSFGMPVAPAPVKQNDISTRIEAVAYALNDNPAGVPYLVISPVCSTLIVGLAGRYHLVREEDGELRPKKDRYSNLCDCLQYGCLAVGAGRRMTGLTALGLMKPMQVYQGRRTMRRISA